MLENQLFQYTIKEILSTNLLKTTPDILVSEVVELMIYNNIPEALIMGESQGGDTILGIMTLTDVSLIKRSNENTNMPVSAYMNRNVLTIEADVLIEDARKILIENSIGRLPVIENNRLIGIVRSDNILNSYYMKLESINLQYKDIINHMHEAVTVTDPQGNVLFWNKSAEKIYGIKAKDILYKPLEDYFPNALTLSVLEEQVAIENIYHSPKPNYFVIISALPIYIDGEFLGVVATERDVTEYRNLSAKLENANLEIDLLKEEVERITKGSFSLGHINGKNPKIQNKIQLAKHVAKTNTSVLITGESGTGKEVFARAIHQHSGRSGHFIPVNCSAIPHTLFESEFFGYVGGAFTGALKNGKIGYFQLANNGTLFLDEIGDLPIELQAKLLRVLQEGKVKPIGSETYNPVDVRIISATNKELKEMVKNSTFREDLYYRLNVVELELPPLRERREDIVLLFNSFLSEICSKNNIKIEYVEKDVFNILLKYNWKGNIRELKNTVEHMVVLCHDGKVTKELIPQYIMEGISDSPKQKSKVQFLDQNLRRLEIDLLESAMKKAKGNKTRAAKILNIPRTTLYYKLKLYEKDLSVHF